MNTNDDAGAEAERSDLVEELRAEADYRGQGVRVGSDKGEHAEAAHLEELLNRAAAALTAQAEEIERLREALKSAEHFADWALRHTWPERAKRNAPDAVYSILANHPFAKALGGKP